MSLRELVRVATGIASLVCRLRQEQEQVRFLHRPLPATLPWLGAVRSEGFDSAVWEVSGGVQVINFIQREAASEHSVLGDLQPPLPPQGRPGWRGHQRCGRAVLSADS